MPLVAISLAALAPLILAGVAWVAYCLWDLYRGEVRTLPRWAWVLIIVFSVPLGGILYLLIGREQQ